MSSEEPNHQIILTNFLVRPCPSNCTLKASCLFFHSPSERRRFPFTSEGIAYTDVICQKILKGEKCSDSCLFAHNFSEMVYHPSKYKTQWCDQSNCKGFFLCYQAHKTNEKLRHPSHFTVGNVNNVTFSSHLNLKLFKTTPCTIYEVHNHKLCVFYHSSKDRRRVQGYSFEMCQDSEKCGKGEECDKSHNKVELLYHVDRYKTKFCTFYPNEVNYCEYAGYCSFAHSESDIKIELIHNYPRNTDFYMYYFKTGWCPFILQHDKAVCVYAHNWQDFRRKPKEANYNSLPCQNWETYNFILSYEEGGCKELMGCDKCHGWKEIEFHPDAYKQKPCSQRKVCPKPQECPYYHSSADRINLTGSPQKILPLPYTPNPKKLFLTPDSIKPSTPIIHKLAQPQQNFPKELKTNSSQDWLHKRSKPRASESRFDITELNFENFYNPIKDNSRSLNSPFKSPNQITSDDNNLDSRVLQFLTRHKLKFLADRFKGIKWEDLESFHLEEHEKSFREAWIEEKEDQEQLDELINNDIALFTGQKAGNTPDLNKFKNQDDVEDYIVTFPKLSLVPQHLICLLTKKLMRDPAIFSLDGKTYERSAIIKHILEAYPKLEAQQLIKSLKSDEHIRKELLLRYS